MLAGASVSESLRITWLACWGWVVGLSPCGPFHRVLCPHDLAPGFAQSELSKRPRQKLPWRGLQGREYQEVRILGGYLRD